MEPEAKELTEIFDRNCESFTAKDVNGYFASIHPGAWTFQAGTFMSIETLRGMADQLLAISESFRVTEWQGGVVVGDAGSAWGRFEYVVNADGARTTTTGSFSAHFVREHGEWLVLFTHYTPEG